MRPFRSFKRLTNSLFHKRNIIIMSERSTAHVSMSARSQLLVIFGLITVISVGSFSTGKYMSARRVIDAQGETIKSVTNSRIEDSYSYGVPNLTSDKLPQEGSEFSERNSDRLTDPSYSFSTLDESKLIARIAYLEGEIKGLKQTNKDIVNVVKVTADSQIKGLEDVIRQTGLSPELLKRQAEQEKKIRRRPVASTANGTGGKGGPYIPANWDEDMRDFVNDLSTSADKLYVLRRILKMMPLSMPLQNARYESPFGRRVDPFNRRIAFHAGTDFSSKNPQVTAPSAGKVTFAGWSGGYGNMVEVDHGLGISTRYGHLSKVLVAEDEIITEGKILGIEGSTGRSTGLHLHYEVRFNNRPINPMAFLNAGKKYVSQE